MSVKEFFSDLLGKLNPIELAKKALLSKYLGGMIRHALTWVGGYLVMKNLATQEQADSAMAGLIALLSSPEFLSGVVASVTGLGASMKQKTEQ